MHDAACILPPTDRDDESPVRREYDDAPGDPGDLPDSKQSSFQISRLPGASFPLFAASVTMPHLPKRLAAV